MKKKLDILYEDKNLLIVNKRANVLTVGTLKEKEHTLYYEASAYVKKQYPKNKVFIINRLDKETSGIVVFAKNIETKKLYQDNWNNNAIVREYLAIVCGVVPNKKGSLKSYLAENKRLEVYKTSDKSGKLAITNYEVLGKNKSYTLLKINILTGRKNQIRYQLSDFGYKIVGDKKYKALKNPINRLGLHASLLKLKIKNQDVIITSKIPKEFKLMFAKEIEDYGKNSKSNC